MKHKNLIKIIIILFVLILCTSIGAYYYSYQRRYSLVEIREPFKSNSLGLLTKMTNEWRAMTTAELLKFVHNSNGSGYYLENSQDSYMTLVVEDAKDKFTFNISESIKILDQKIPEKTKEFKKIKSGQIKIAELDTDALMYEFSNVSSGTADVISSKPVESKPYKIKKIIFLMREKMYYFDFAARSDDYPKDVREFDKIIQSLGSN